jgi:hypothetical protein
MVMSYVKGRGSEKMYRRDVLAALSGQKFLSATAREELKKLYLPKWQLG